MDFDQHRYCVREEILSVLWELSAVSADGVKGGEELDV